jgi:calcineurin-like phosphoesterase family protein
MNEALITNWNSVVGPDDLVYIIGDISMSASKDKLKAIFDRLNGTKILIKGNHDRTKNIPAECFEQVVKRLQITGEGYDFILVHDPAEASANHMSTQKYLCGHLHSSKDRRIYYNWIDVGVDANDYTPLALEEILKIFEDEAKKGLSVDELL